MKDLKPILLAGLILTTPAIAWAQYNLGDQIGTTDDEIIAAMTESGYDVRSIERGEDEIEVEVMIDGVETEFVLALADGKLIEIDTDDDKTDDH